MLALNHQSSLVRSWYESRSRC